VKFRYPFALSSLCYAVDFTKPLKSQGEVVLFLKPKR